MRLTHILKRFAKSSKNTSMETVVNTSSNGQRWLRQLGFTGTYFLLPLFISVRGTCYLDLVEIYETSIPAMSVAFMITGLGGFTGGNIVGILQDRLASIDLYLMSLFTLGASLALGSAAICPSVHWLYADFFFAGVCMSFTLGSSRALCFKNWRDTKFGSGPFVHSLFLFQSLGFFAAPLVAKPFLSSGHNNDKFNDTHLDNVKKVDNLDELFDLDDVEHEESRIHVLFPALGAALAALAIYYLLIGLRLIGCGGGASISLSVKTTTTKDSENVEKPSLKWQERLLIFLTATIFFFDFSLQTGISNFLIASVMRGPEMLSKEDGVYLLAIYFFAQLMSRVMSIVASLMLTPNQTLCFFMTIMLTAASALVFVETLWLIQVFYGLLGLGAGSILGTSLTWLEQYVHVGGGISGLASMGTATGLIFSTAVFGQLLETYPRLLTFHQLFVAIAYSTIFISGTVLGKSVHKEGKIEEKIEKEGGENVDHV